MGYGRKDPQTIRIEATTDAGLKQKVDGLESQLAEKAEKNLSLQVGTFVPAPTLLNVEMQKTDPGARFIDYFDDKMWGYKSTGEIHYSVDEGETWILYTNTWDSTWGFISSLVPTSDGEVLALTSSQIRKSIGWNTGNVTWSANKVTPYGTANFNAFGFDGDGTKFILVEYDSSQSTWSNSRYGHISTDSGETFVQVWDSVAQHGETDASSSHLHGACYDRWADRFYIGEGHGFSGGLYCSVDDGATWLQGEGHKAEVLRFSDGQINAPTVIMATDEGLVMGSDNRNNGLFGLVRKGNPLDEVVTRIYEANYQRLGVVMFAQRGWRDSRTGTVYITFRSEFSDVPPIICAGNPHNGGLVYEYPTLPVVGGADRFAAVARVSDNRLVAYAQFGGNPYTMRGDLVWDHSQVPQSIAKMIKLDTVQSSVESSEELTSGETTIPREFVTAPAAATSSGQMALTYFTAKKNETISKIRMYSSANAGATPTLVRLGVYEVSENGDLTLVASIANDTGLFSVQNGEYIRNLTSPFNKQTGKRYAVGLLVVSSTTIPTLYGVTASSVAGSMWGLAPRKSGAVTGLTDLPSTITSTSVTNSGRLHFISLEQ